MSSPQIFFPNDFMQEWNCVDQNPSIAQKIQGQQELFHSAKNRSLKKGCVQKLGVDSSDPKASEKVTHLMKQLHQGGGEYVYCPEYQTVQFRKNGEIQGHFKAGTYRGNREKALQSAAKVLGLQRYLAPTYIGVLEGERLKPISVKEMEDYLPEKSTFQRSDCVLFSVETYDGKLLYITENTSENKTIQKSDLLSIRGPIVGSWSPHIEESSNEVSNLDLNKLHLLAAVFNIRDFGRDNIIPDKNGIPVCVDYEEMMGLNGEGRTTLFMPDLEKRDTLVPLNREEIGELLELVNAWDYGELEKALKESKIRYRNPRLENLEIREREGELQKAGELFFEVNEGRDLSFYPSRSLEDTQLFTDDQIDQCLERARRISFAVRRAQLAHIIESQRGSAKEADKTYTCWTTVLSADSTYKDYCSQFAQNRSSASLDDGQGTPLSSPVFRTRSSSPGIFMASIAMSIGGVTGCETRGCHLSASDVLAKLVSSRPNESSEVPG